MLKRNLLLISLVFMGNLIGMDSSSSNSSPIMIGQDSGNAQDNASSSSNAEASSVFSGFSGLLPSWPASDNNLPAIPEDHQMAESNSPSVWNRMGTGIASSFSSVVANTGTVLSNTGNAVTTNLQSGLQVLNPTHNINEIINNLTTNIDKIVNDSVSTAFNRESAIIIKRMSNLLSSVLIKSLAAYMVYRTIGNGIEIKKASIIIINCVSTILFIDKLINKINPS